MEKAVIRQARLSDVDEIMRLYRQLMGFHEALDPRFAVDWDHLDGYRDYVTGVVLRSTMHRLFVAEAPASRGLAGFIMGHVAENPPIFRKPYYGSINDMCVDEQWRRQGIGAALFEAMRAWFREQGVLTMQLNAAARNPVSQAFWRAMGFTDLLDRLWCQV